MLNTSSISSFIVYYCEQIYLWRPSTFIYSSTSFHHYILQQSFIIHVSIWTNTSISISYSFSLIVEWHAIWSWFFSQESLLLHSTISLISFINLEICCIALSPSSILDLILDSTSFLKSLEFKQSSQTSFLSRSLPFAFFSVFSANLMFAIRCGVILVESPVLWLLQKYFSIVPLMQ